MRIEPFLNLVTKWQDYYTDLIKALADAEAKKDHDNCIRLKAKLELLGANISDLQAVIQREL